MARITKKPFGPSYKPNRSDPSAPAIFPGLLMYSTDAHGRIVSIDSRLAKAVMAASSRSLRETDYIGWYRDGRILGAVLTVLVQETMAEVSTHLKPRLVGIIRAEWVGIRPVACRSESANITIARHWIRRGNIRGD